MPKLGWAYPMYGVRFWDAVNSRGTGGFHVVEVEARVVNLPLDVQVHP